ncbi:unnamed protein product, partial [Polarella glacialis]
REILPLWPKDKNSWKPWLGRLFADKGAQCLFPEVSRVSLASADCLGKGEGSDLSAPKVASSMAAEPRKCSEEEAQLQRSSALSVMSGGLAVNLGDTSRLEAAAYRDLFLRSWPGGQGLQQSRALSSVEELEAFLGHEPLREASTLYKAENGDRDRALGQPPLRLVVRRQGVLQESRKRTDSWPSVAAYFGFSPNEPRATYMGIMRIWWRNLVLYLVVDPASPLLLEVEGAGLWSWFSGGRHSPQVPGSAFARRLALGASLKEPPPRPVPPGVEVGAAPLGESCSRHCESRRQVCIDADLMAIASCAAPLTLAFGCKGCTELADDSSAPGLLRDSGHCVGGARAPGAPKGTDLRAGDCAASSPRVRRLCVCRKPRRRQRDLSAGALPRLMSPGRRFSREVSVATIETGTSAQRLGAFSAAVAGRLPGAHTTNAVNVSRFAMPSGGPPPKSVVEAAEQILVLVVAPAVQENNWRALRETLDALREVSGMRPSRVLVANRGEKQSLDLIKEFGFQSLPLGLELAADVSEPRRIAATYRDALDGAAAAAKAVQARSILVLEEGLRLSPDLLSFVGQLEAVLQVDRSAWCVSAWNDNGLAPYVADATVVIRADWFSGIAWLARLDTVVNELLPRWPEVHWRKRVWEMQTRSGRQCLIPEVSRAVPKILVSKDGLPKAAGQKLSVAEELILRGSPLVRSTGVDLGDVYRLHQGRYSRLFLSDWPQEGLANAKPLLSLRPLADGRANSGGPWILTFKNKDVETDVSWKAVASFFGLWPEAPIRGAYLGVLRLRWRDSVLFLVASSSPLLASSGEQHVGEKNGSSTLPLSVDLQ